MPRDLPNMDTSTGVQPYKEGTTTPTRGEVKPIHIFSGPRRETNGAVVADLRKALERDGGFLHPIAVRAEGTAWYRLIAGRHRLEAWERCFGNHRPIPATIYPSGTPDARITILEIQENLFRKELTAAQRESETLRLAAALKRLDGEKLATELPVSGSDAKSAASGGRGKKAATTKLAGKLGLSKAATQKRIKAASAAIGEKIDLDRDTPEELERKADKRQRAERKVERPKRCKPAPHGVIEDLWKAFDAIGRADKLRFIHDACLGLGLDPLKMASPTLFGLADEGPESAVDLTAEGAPATADAAVDSQADEQDEATVAQAEQGDDAADIGAEDPQDAGDDVPEVADHEPGGATKCAYCNQGLYSGDQRQLVNGRLYHGFCVEDAKQIAIAAE